MRAAFSGSGAHCGPSLGKVKVGIIRAAKERDTINEKRSAHVLAREVNDACCCLRGGGSALDSMSSRCWRRWKADIVTGPSLVSV